MKKIVKLIVILLSSIQFYAQTSSVYLDQNNVSALILDEGMLFYDNDLGAAYEVPKNSNITAIYSAAFWFGALDDMGTLKLAGTLYNQSGKDFFSGPISATNMYATPEYQTAYSNAIWTVKKSDIIYHLNNYQEENYVPINSIVTWPGNGITSLGVSQQLAPYIDVDNDNIYNPINGDYPCIKGDMTSYIIMNDMEHVHSESGGNPLNIEIHVMAYQFSASNYIDTTTFINVRVINKGIETLQNFKTAFFFDTDLGNYTDDYVGCDSSKNIIYTYNGDSVDEASSLNSFGYQENPPSIGVVSLNKNLSGMVYFSNEFSNAMSDPTTALHYYNYMNGLWKDSTQRVYGGTGYLGSFGSINTPSNFMFSGNPFTAEGWSEVTMNNPKGDRRMIMHIDLDDLDPNEETTIDYAILFARKYDGIPLSSVNEIYNLADSVKQFYDVNLASTNCVFEENGIKENHSEIKFYPNPTNDKITLVFPNQVNNIKYEIKDLQGKTIISGQPKGKFNNLSISLENVSNGSYTIEISDENGEKYVNKIMVIK